MDFLPLYLLSDTELITIDLATLTINVVKQTRRTSTRLLKLTVVLFTFLLFSHTVLLESVVGIMMMIMMMTVMTNKSAISLYSRRITDGDNRDTMD